MTNAKAIVVKIPKELKRKELNETLSKGRVSGREPKSTTKSASDSPRFSYSPAHIQQKPKNQKHERRIQKSNPILGN
ncbi:hypothetical protein Lepto782_12230 [Leptospira interrogans serovar Canicola]|uniref:Uncharacterized protein n=1 Tax=Leptospira interrogans serovar Canicola TaxID=211880 RepID=A0AAP9WF29_LEPIR|nr:hypothetical protein [Leptospira interrogans]QOI42949.1 hypothetical protein Lepto782_12230 [Leptospira interrogans serovar Canicola]